MRHKHFIIFLFTLLSSAAVTAQSNWTKAPIPGLSDIMSMDCGSDACYLLNTSGLYKSTDDGDTWSLVPGSTGLLALRPQDVSVPIRIYAGASGTTVYALVPHWSQNVGTGVEFYLHKSTNSGTSWSLMRKELIGHTAQRRGNFEVRGDTLLATNINSVLECSTDNGQTWTYALIGGNPLVGVSRLSEDGGLTCVLSQLKHLLVTTDYVEWDTAYIFPTQPHRIEVLGSAIVANIGLNKNLLISHDTGMQWDTAILPVAPANAEFYIEKNGSSIFYQANNGTTLYRSDNWGETWSSCAASGYEPGGVDHWGVSNGNLLNSNGNPPSVSGDLGESFSPVTGINTAAFITCFARSGDNWYTGTKHGFFVSHDAGQTWQKAFGQSNNANSLPRDVAAYGDVVMAPTLDGLQISKDKGETWIKKAIFIDYAGYGQCISAGGDGYFYILSWPSVKRSSNGGNTWQELQDPFLTSGPVFVEAEAETMVAGYYGDEVFFSTEHGDNLKPLAPPIPVPLPPTSNEAMLRAKIAGDDIYILTTKRLYKGNTEGNWTTVWENTIADTNNIDLSRRSYLFKVKDALYVGLQGKKMQTSLNGGTNWSNWSGLPSNLVFQTGYVDEEIMVAGFDNGLYWRANSDLPTFGGKVFVDANGNNLPDPGETPIPGAIVFTSDGQNYASTDAEGRYQFVYYPSPGNVLYVKPPLDYYNAAVSELPVAAPGDTYHFGIVLTPDVFDLNIAAAGTADPKPGYENSWSLTYANKGTEIADGTVSLTLKPPFNFVSADPAPSSVVSNTVTWNIASVPVFGSGNVAIKLSLPSDAPEGAAILGTAIVTTVTGNDANIADNTVEIATTIVDSYDPNDKLVLPSGNLTPQMVADGQRMIYTVRFQNTGTAEAIRVRINDTLDQNLAIQSLELLGSGHSVEWSLRGNGVLEFIFDNINLPPVSQDEPGSQGFAQFALFAKNNLVVGDKIENRAHIFFDYNAPIVTNRVSNLVALPSSTHNTEEWQLVNIYPIPASEQIRVEWQGGERIQYQMFSADGVLLQSGAIEPTEGETISVQKLTPGSYNVVFQYNGKVFKRSFVKI